MPDKDTIKRARRDKRQGKAPSTQAGEFVREEIEHIRDGEHGARSTKQAIAIGLSKARKAGVDLRPPARGKTSERTRRSAQRAYREGHDGARHTPSRRRSRAMLSALKKEGHSAASRKELSKHARAASARRTRADRSASAQKAARTRQKTAHKARRRAGAR